MRLTDRQYRFDWITILLFFLLVSFGWLNILSASQTGEVIKYFSFNSYHGKQLIFIILSIALIVFILSLDSKFYERFSSIIYIISILSLLGLFAFGKNINGATSWYAIGNMTIQPSEFAKAATALAVAKFVSDLQTNIKRFKDQLRLFLIILLPALLILLQKDAGSTLVYGAFFFVLYREGLPKIYLIVIMALVILSILSLKFGTTITMSVFSVLVFIYYFSKAKKPALYKPILSFIIGLGFSFLVLFVYENQLPNHQKDRITIWLSLEKDASVLEKMKKKAAYNLLESEKAISSGGFRGKGFMQGTRTTGKFVPEQHTDYIFTTVGEEWGFIGSFAVVIVFILLILRLLHLAELQKSQFSRVYGYSVAAIFFLHFLINIGMVMGLIPTIGIPLPFFSYGGSGLWGFTILLFIFIKLDSNRINQW